MILRFCHKNLAILIAIFGIFYARPNVQAALATNAYWCVGIVLVLWALFYAIDLILEYIRLYHTDMGKMEIKAEEERLSDGKEWARLLKENWNDPEAFEHITDRINKKVRKENTLLFNRWLKDQLNVRRPQL